MKKLFALTFFSLAFLSLQGQNQTDRRWYIQSLSTDGVYGTAVVESAHLLAKRNPSPKKVIVAVIDSGTDTSHTYLKDYLWTNPHEIPDNQQDDDGNGYIDDVHGWSFIPDVNGKAMVTPKGADVLFFQLRDIKSKRPFTQEEQRQMDRLWKISPLPLMAEEVEAMTSMYQLLERVEESCAPNHDPRFIHRRNLTHYLQQHHDELKEADRNLIRLIVSTLGAESSWVEIKDKVKQRMEESGAQLEAARKKSHRNDRTLVRDDLNALRDHRYGEAKLDGENAAHGTHVAGTVVRIVKAVEEELKIKLPLEVMVLKAIPKGDETDKDVALAIRYAVDQGAQIINMSFGKTTSTHPQWVSDALDYAASKDVLVVHAASNENRNLEEINYYPSPFNQKGKARKNLLTIGASDADGLPASFSNYGKHTVDFFAPGVDIYASVPGNSYTYLSGTSMAAPVVSGLAALLRMYYPEKSAQEIKEAFVKSAKNSPAADEMKANKGKPGIQSYQEICLGTGVVDLRHCIEWMDSPKKSK